MYKQHVLTFLREWLKYSDACMKAHKAGDALPHSQVFTPWDGLCGNLDKWTWANNRALGACESFDSAVSLVRGLSSTLKALFRADRLCSTYPFGERSFHRRMEIGSNCRCPNRRRWVKKTIAQLEKGLADGNH